MRNKVILRTIAAVLVAVAVMIGMTGCDMETRLKLVKGFDEGGILLEGGQWRDYVLSMIDVEYTALEDGDTVAEEVKEAASVVMEVYEGFGMTATVYVTNDCRILVVCSGGGLWYTQTPAVDTVLICAAFAEGGDEREAEKD